MNHTARRVMRRLIERADVLLSVEGGELVLHGAPREVRHWKPMAEAHKQQLVPAVQEAERIARRELLRIGEAAKHGREPGLTQ